MNEKFKISLYLLIGLLSGFLIMYLFNNYKIEKKNQTENSEIIHKMNDFDKKKINYSKNEYSTQNNNRNSSQGLGNIEELTNENTVISFVKQNHQLPDCYLTKSEAKRNGWNPSQGNLCDVLPGKAIGGDYFSNREGNLPKGEQYFEADVNYSCGNRQADRIIFTKNGDVWLTHDHYKSFQKQ